MNDLNYQHLLYFHRVAKEGSVTRACKSLYLSQPTVSLQIQSLERSMGRKLFERKGRSLHLTDDGRMVFDYADRIFGLGDELRDAIRDRRPEGRMAIQIGVLSGTPRSFAHALVEKALELEPLAHVELREGAFPWLLGELRDQRIDLILSDHPASGGAPGSFVNHLVGKIPIVFAAAGKLAKKLRVFPNDFHGAPFVLPAAPSQVYQQIQDFFASRHLAPRVVAEVPDVEVARRLAISGHGIVPLNALTFASSQPRGALRIVAARPIHGLHELLYLIATPRRWPNPLGQRLVKEFRAES